MDGVPGGSGTGWTASEEDTTSGAELGDLDTSVGLVQLERTVENERTKEEAAEEEEDEEVLLARLAHLNYQVFVLSESGRPVYNTCGNDEKLCSLFALINVFMLRVKLWDDELDWIGSSHSWVKFSHRPPLMMAIIARQPHKLGAQLDALWNQIISVVSLAQMKRMFQMRGDNFDLRPYLRGTNRYMDWCVSSWRADASLFLGAVRMHPMQAQDRDLLANTMVAAAKQANLDDLLFALVIARRRLVTVARLRKFQLAPGDLHVLFTLFANNRQFDSADSWTPVCLPHFNDNGFVHAHVGPLWDDVDGTQLVLLSTNRNHFQPLSVVKADIRSRLESQPRACDSIKSALREPHVFRITKIAGWVPSDPLWHFIYLNRSTRQMCEAAWTRPLCGDEERRRSMALYLSSAHQLSLCPTNSVYARHPHAVLYVHTTDKMELFCTLSPLTSPSVASALVHRLMKALRNEENRHFLKIFPSF